jgi:hypothetical protein
MTHDAQSRAYRDMDNWEHYSDIELPAYLEHRHDPIGDISEVRLPEWYEARLWDAGREDPKTPAQAQAALTARIADPTAPDGPEVADAYDELDD